MTEEKITQLLSPAIKRHSRRKQFHTALITLAIATAIFGGGFYAWQQSQSKNTSQQALDIGNRATIDQKGTNNIAAIGGHAAISIINPHVQKSLSWSDYSTVEHEAIRAQAFALFPEILDLKQKTKWAAVEAWLRDKYGINHETVRSLFRLSGEKGRSRYFVRFEKDKAAFLRALARLDEREIRQHWKREVPATPEKRLEAWLKIARSRVVNAAGEAEAERLFGNLRYD